MRVRNARDTIDISCAEYIKYHHSIKYVHESNQCRSVNCLCCELGRTTFFIDIAMVRSLQHQSIVSIVTMPEPICHCCHENISLLPLIWGFKGTFLVKYFQYPRENCNRFTVLLSTYWWLKVLVNFYISVMMTSIPLKQTWNPAQSLIKIIKWTNTEKISEVHLWNQTWH